MLSYYECYCRLLYFKPVFDNEREQVRHGGGPQPTQGVVVEAGVQRDHIVLGNKYGNNTTITSVKIEGGNSSHVFAGDGQRVVARPRGAEAERGDARAADVLAAIDVAMRKIFRLITSYLRSQK